MSRDRWTRLVKIVIAGALTLGSGCSHSDASRYIPTPVVAEEALRAALEAWREGQPVGKITSYRVPIHVADTQRRPGQKLKSYDILGQISEDGGRRYQVRLNLENPEVEEKAQYIVVGIDPLWVFRREDYDMVTHWDHPMPSAPSAETTASSPQAAAAADSK